MKNGALTMDVLVVMGTTVAYLFSIYNWQFHPELGPHGIYFETSAWLITFILLGKLLEEIAEQINVGIDPELMYLISKDANNRCEMKITESGLELDKSAGSIGCYNGPTPTKSLSHPALVDKVLVDYMIEKAINQNDTKLKQEFDRNLAKKLMAQTLNSLNNTDKLLYLQNVLASTSTSYIFANNPRTNDVDIIQMYNRAFMVTDKDPNHVFLERATAQAILPATIQKRKRNNEITVQHNPLALRIMNKHGYYDFEENTEANIVKITGVETTQPIRIYNGDLHILSDEEAKDIFKYIDVEAYIDLFETAYNNSWKNNVPEYDEFVDPLSEDSYLTNENIMNYIDMEDKKSQEYVSTICGG